MSIEAAFKRVNSAVQDGRAVIGRFREQYLAALHQSLIESEQELLSSLQNEFGRHQAESRLELLLVLKHIEGLFGSSTLASIKEIQKKMASEGSFKRPIGSVTIVASEQAPIESWAGPLASAIAAGCPALVVAPNTLQSIKTIIEGVFAKLDRTAFQVVFIQQGELAKSIEKVESDAIVVSSRQDSLRKAASARGAARKTILFPPSVEKSLKVNGTMALVSEHVKRADLPKIARLVVRAAFVGNGANLNGIDYVLVHEVLHAEFVDLVTSAAKEMYGADSSFQKGKTASTADASSLVAEQTKSGKAQIVFGGAKQGSAIGMTVIDNVDESSDLVRFGTTAPVLPILPVTSTEHVIAIQTASPSSTCFIFADTAECNYYAREITTATIFANDIPLEAIVGISSTVAPIRLATSLLQATTTVVQHGKSILPNVFAPFPPSAIQAITKVWPGRAALKINRKAHNNSLLRAFFPQGLFLTAGTIMTVLLSALGYGGYVGISKLLQYRSSL